MAFLFGVFFSRFQTPNFSQKSGEIDGFNSQKLFVVGQALILAKASWLRATWASA